MPCINKGDWMDNLEDIKWSGYLRQDGKIGIRNKVLVMYTVECAAFVAKEVVRRINNPEVEVVGFSGCTDNTYALNLLLALIRHPNVGGVYVIGLGCEYLQAEKLSQYAAEKGKFGSWLLIQNEGGTKKSIEKACENVEEILEKLEDTKIVPMGFADLIVGAECGGSDYTSGLAGNVVVGRFFDFLVNQKGIAIFEEIVEAVGLKEMLVKRGISEEAREELASTYDKAMEYCKKVKQYSISPGNFVGGLTTIEEKSMGALIKSGSQPIQGVLKVAEEVKNKGLWLLDSTPDPYFMDFGFTNPNDNEGLTDLVASGAQLLFLVTGRGNVVGSAISPVIKITGNNNTYSYMQEDMDFNAGDILSGACTIEDSVFSLIKLVTQICAGEKTKAEELGHKEFFIPYKYQDDKKSKRERCEGNVTRGVRA